MTRRDPEVRRMPGAAPQMVTTAEYVKAWDEEGTRFLRLLPGWTFASCDPDLRFAQYEGGHVVDSLVISVVAARTILGEVDPAKRRIETAARNLFAALDHTVPEWREKTVCKEGDEVNAAWLELAEALGQGGRL